MIARHWSAVARKDRAADYIHHLRTETFPALNDIPGFRKASILKRDTASGVEFLIITEWVNIEAIKKFAGDDPGVAVVPEVVKRMMLSFDTTVRHFDIDFVSELRS